MNLFRDRMILRLSQLIFGLALFGLAIALILKANLGAGPWDVLTQGISLHVPLTFGMITILLGATVLLLWIPLKQKPGIGTVANVILIGVFADIGLAVFPTPEGLPWQLAILLLGIVLLGAASGLYIGAGLGPGPRDGLMTGLHARTRVPIWLVRIGIEVTVLVLGWLLGGVVGIGTVAAAFLIGPTIGVFLPIFKIKDAPEQGQQPLEQAGNTAAVDTAAPDVATGEEPGTASSV